MGVFLENSGAKGNTLPPIFFYSKDMGLSGPVVLELVGALALPSRLVQAQTAGLILWVSDPSGPGMREP